MKRAAVIVAAGSGRRMGLELPKQYLELLGKPILIHTLERFRLFDPEMHVIVVLAGEHQKFWERVCASYEIASQVSLVLGGATRYDSVKQGLNSVDEAIVTGIHDAVRPLVSLGTLERTYDVASREGSGIPVIEMDDSVRIQDPDGGSAPMDRSRLLRVQTPQVFQTDKIKQAYRQSRNTAFTDDATVYESVFGRVCLVEGNRENIKITGPADMKLAALLMGSAE